MTRSQIVQLTRLCLVALPCASATADVVGPYSWQGWQAAVSGQPRTSMRINLLMDARGYVPGQVIPGDAFAAEFGATFVSSSPFARGTGAQERQLVVQTTGATASICWSGLVYGVYYLASGQQQISFYSGNNLLRTVDSPFSETGFTAAEGFDRMEFLTKPDSNLQMLRFEWVTPAPGVSGLFVLLGAALSSRRRRA